MCVFVFLLIIIITWKEPIVQHVRLRKVYIDGCNKLKSIFSAHLVHKFFSLQQLQVYDCEELEEVFDSTQEEVPFLSPILFIFHKVKPTLLNSSYLM